MKVVDIQNGWHNKVCHVSRYRLCYIFKTCPQNVLATKETKPKMQYIEMDGCILFLILYSLLGLMLLINVDNLPSK